LTKELLWLYGIRKSVQIINLKTAFILIVTLFVFLPNVSYSMQFDEGIDYKVINNKKNKLNQDTLEVVEFFGYFCPHCKSFEPSLKKWERSLPKNIKFTQLHVPFRDINHQRLFFTLKNINSEEKLQNKIFNAIQVQGNPLNNFLEILSWVESHGVDEKEFEKSWNSKKVKSEMNNATKLMKLYKIDGVPQLIVNGTYSTSPAMVGGSHRRVLKLVDYLLNKK
jgi:thiol:disulfide interchange protein DsbA